jgi:hypothetical protein
MRKRTALQVGAGAVAILLSVAFGPSRAVAASEGAKTEGQVSADPQTAEQHLARAGEYDEKAKAARVEAETHRTMLADFKTKDAAIQSKHGAELPWVGKMRAHCEAYIRDADAVTKDAEEFAKYHRMRADELRGK